MAMAESVAAPAWARALEFGRFLVAGVVNAGIGYAAYALFVYLGLGVYLSQALGHTVGTAFNYFSHSLFVFKMRPKLVPYLASSSINYVAGVAFLAATLRIVASPYWAGLIATGCTAVFSYLSLKVLAFRRRQLPG